ncbi:MAG: hypothetical protein JXD18_11655 [Anaerolineae bacterium]|nr:hypothetical protein [Anaerolineae bacterium]
MNKKIVVACVVVGLAITLSVSVALATGYRWPGSTSTNLSNSKNLRVTTFDMGSNGDMAVAWARSDLDRVYGSLNTGSGWSAPTALVPDMNAWSPYLAYADTTPFLTWVSGDLPVYQTTVLTIYEREMSGGTPRVVADGIYASPQVSLWPNMAAGQDGLHIVFAATDNITDSNAYRWDLYYTYRPYTQTNWIEPTVVVTYSQVVPESDPGTRVWYPRVSESPDGKVHVVWRQEERYGMLPEYSIWYVEGTRSGSDISWGSAVQLSPGSQLLAARPDILADAAGRVHVVWAELSDTANSPEEQYPNYMQLGWAAPIRLDPSYFKVSAMNPTWVRATLAVRGERVCVTWHGFREDEVPLGHPEEILLRCSMDGGQTWDELLNISNTPTDVSVSPVSAIDATGRIHIVWEENTGAIENKYDYDVYYAYGPTQVDFVFLPLVFRGF